MTLLNISEFGAADGGVQVIELDGATTVLLRRNCPCAIRAFSLDGVIGD